MKGLLKYLSVVLGLLLLILIRNNTSLDGIAVYVNDELKDSIPKKGEAMYVKSVCDNDGKATWDNETWGLLVTNMSKKTRCNLYFYEGQTVFDFDYTGSEQVFTVPVSGTYKLETWGSQGGSGVNKNTDTGDNTYLLREGGYGGYSSGILELKAFSDIFLNVGGGGKQLIEDTTDITAINPSGYNGGGNGLRYASGGGATHIATKSGLLSTLENYKSSVLIVAGGGGGTSVHSEGGGFCIGGAGGGYVGKNGSSPNPEYWGNGGSGATQISGYKFGLGFSSTLESLESQISGGGGGFYGGFTGDGSTSWSACGGGGSGYIGNTLLKDKVMYCYNCEESSEEATKTVSTTCSEETPTENCAKKGNGYARITLVSIDE